MKTHRDLDLWKNSIDVVTDIYEITKIFPKDELYSLTNQIRRAAISIPSNIAEGAARNYDKEFIQFLYIAQGSLAELETQLIISQKLNYIKIAQSELLLNKLNKIRAQLTGLIRYLKNQK